ncbi:DUF4232 domain-containing protein [Acidiphilium sp.]|uniref:DUF4232 domain-containing protein n=1 Tax=Acidiphilium sp. TaxID=527 RepID=UPI00258A6F7A|nr:DUF4232 domain-containing protein [Acidiphilium sp.]
MRAAAAGLALPLLVAGCARPAAVTVCSGARIVARTDSEGGAFDGMSHSGTLVVLRNPGPAPCTLPGLPRLVFLDAADHELPVVRRPPVGMHPGPVVLPVRLEAGAAATTALRWVADPVYTRNACMKVAALRIAWPGGETTLALAATICGPKGAAAGIAQSPLALAGEKTLSGSGSPGNR